MYVLLFLFAFSFIRFSLLFYYSIIFILTPFAISPIFSFYTCLFCVCLFKVVLVEYDVFFYPTLSYSLVHLMRHFEQHRQTPFYNQPFFISFPFPSLSFLFYLLLSLCLKISIFLSFFYFYYLCLSVFIKSKYFLFYSSSMLLSSMVSLSLLYCSLYFVMLPPVYSFVISYYFAILLHILPCSLYPLFCYIDIFFNSILQDL